MKRILKWSGLGFVGLIVALLCVYSAMHVMSESRLNAVYNVKAGELIIPADAASIAMGKRLAITRGCVDCHGDDLGGKLFIDDAAFGRLAGSNLTRGEGGVGDRCHDSDWVRAIRHGVRSDGRPLTLMPSNEFYFLSDDDLACIISYVKQLSPVNNVLPEKKVGALARVLFEIGKLPVLIPAALIDHNAERPSAPVAGITPEYGRYLTVGCQGCHKSDLAGGDPVAPGYPSVPSLTGTGNLTRWSESDFIRTLRNGVTPEGKRLQNEFMPWQNLGQMTDNELKAVWSYLLTVRGNPTPLATTSSVASPRHRD